MLIGAALTLGEQFSQAGVCAGRGQGLLSEGNIIRLQHLVMFGAGEQSRTTMSADCG